MTRFVSIMFPSVAARPFPLNELTARLSRPSYHFLRSRLPHLSCRDHLVNRSPADLLPCHIALFTPCAPRGLTEWDQAVVQKHAEEPLSFDPTFA